MSDERRLRATPAEIKGMRQTIVDLRAKLLAAEKTLFARGEEAGRYVSEIKAELAQARAVAAAMVETIALHEWEERFDAIGSRVVEACPICDATREQGHGTDCWLGQLLSQHKEPTNGEEESETQVRPAQADDGVGGGG